MRLRMPRTLHMARTLRTRRVLHPEYVLARTGSRRNPARRRTGTAVGTVLALFAVSAAWVMGAAPEAGALPNGLALTPPMGWNSWNKFGCNVTEQKVESVADYLVSSGLAAAGYTYVDIDDCWMAGSRDLPAASCRTPSSSRTASAAPLRTCTARA